MILRGGIAGSGSVLAVAVAVITMMSGAAAAQPAMDDFLKLNYNTEQCLGTCEAQFEVSNPTAFDISISDSSDFDVWFEVATGPGISGWELFREEDVSYYATVLDFGTCEGWRIDEQTSKNITYQFECQTGSHKELRWRPGWKPFDPMEKTLKSGETWKIRLLGYKKIVTGTNNVDWRFTFNGMSPPWAWWNSSWQYKTPIDVDQSGSTELQDFPINITVNTSELIDEGKMNADCSDIRLVNASEVLDAGELDFEFESHGNTDFGCDTERTVMWVEVDSIPSSNTTIFLYYGNNQSGFANNTRATWDEGTIGVWHFGEGSGTTTLNSTEKGGSGDLSDVDWSDAFFGKGIETFGNSTSHVNITEGYETLTSMYDFTISFWANLKTLTLTNSDCTGSGNRLIASDTTFSGDNDLYIMVSTSGAIYARPSTNGSYNLMYTSSGIISAGNWYNIVFVRNTTGPDYGQIWVNGELKKEARVNPIRISKGALIVGTGHYPSQRCVNGTIDELRIYDHFLTQDEIKRNYEVGLAELLPEIERDPCNGTLMVDLITPTEALELTKDETFTLTASATCSAPGSCCGNVRALADPRVGGDANYFQEESGISLEKPRFSGFKELESFLGGISAVFRTIILWLKGV